MKEAPADARRLLALPVSSRRVRAVTENEKLVAFRIAEIGAVGTIVPARTRRTLVRPAGSEELGGLGAGLSAMSRAQRNRLIEGWAGREWALRQNAAEVGKQITAARAAGDVDNAPLSFGQDAGLIDSIRPVREVVDAIVGDAEAIIRRLPSLLR